MELAKIFTATPAEIDTELSALQDKLLHLHRIIDRDIHALGQTKSERSLQLIELKIADARAKAKIISNLTVALGDEYKRRGGWSRVHAVNNTNGHFHTTRACRNTYDTTEWVWMPELSGLSAAEVVARTGKMSCLTCFYGQREEIEKGREATVFTPVQAKAREERDEFARRSAQIAAEKAAKSITNPDGTPLRNDHGVIKTLRTAWIEAVDELVWAEYSEDIAKTSDQYLDGERLVEQVAWSKKQMREHYESTLIIAKAIAHKTERDLADVLTEIVKKADVKIRKARRERAAEKND